jgi:hypothetical protein
MLVLDRVEMGLEMALELDLELDHLVMLVIMAVSVLDQVTQGLLAMEPQQVLAANVKDVPDIPFPLNTLPLRRHPLLRPLLLNRPLPHLHLATAATVRERVRHQNLSRPPPLHHQFVPPASARERAQS